MAQSLRRTTEPEPIEGEPETVEALLEQAETLIDRAGEEIEDPIELNKLKEAQFTLWQLRNQR